MRDVERSGPEHGRLPGDGLAAAVGLLSAKLAGIHTTATDLTPDVDQAAIIRALVIVTTALLNASMPANAQALLQDLGLDAADGITNGDPDGSR